MTIDTNSGDTPLESAILDTLSDLTTEWQSFAGGATSDAKRNAMLRLIVCGIAKTRLHYTVSKRT